MAHEVFHEQAQLTGKSNSPTLERKGVFLMSDGTNINVETKGSSVESQRVMPQKGVLESLPFLPDTVKNEGLKTQFQNLEVHLSEKPVEDWDSDDYRSELRNWNKLALDASTSDEHNAEIPRVTREVAEEILARAIRKGQNPAELIAAVQRDLGGGEIENLPEVVQMQILGLVHRGKLTQEEANAASDKVGSSYKRIEGKPSSESGPKRVNIGGESLRTISPKEIEDASKQGVEALRALFARHGIAEDKAASLSESFVPLAFSIDPAEPEWQFFANGRTGFTNGRIQFFAERIARANSGDILNGELIEGVRQRVVDDFDKGLVPDVEAMNFITMLDALRMKAPERNPLEREIEGYGAFTMLLKSPEFARMLGEAETPGFDPAKYNEIKNLILSYIQTENTYSEAEIQDIKDNLLPPEAQMLHANPDVRKATAEKLRYDMQIRLAERLSPAAPMSETAITALIDNQDATEKLIIRIISTPLFEPMRQYRLGFYPANNLDLIKQAMEDALHKPGLTPGKKSELEAFKERMYSTMEAIDHMHNMNYLLMTNQLEQFASAARSIPAEHLQVMMDVPGVATSFRIIEGELQRILARDGMISFVPPKSNPDQVPNYNELFGYSKKERDPHTGKIVERRVEGTIDKLFAMTSEGHTPGTEGMKLQEWQRAWGAPISKYLYNMFFRSAEIISLGKLPHDKDFGEGKDDQGMIARLPFNQVSTFMDILKLVATRYGVGKTSGGIKLIEMTYDSFDRDRTESGWDSTLLSRVKNLRINDLEHSGMLGIVGFFRSWRNDLALFRTAPFWHPEIDADGRGKKTNMRDYIDKGLNPDASYNRGVDRAELLRRTFLTGTGELKSEFNNSLGLLLQDSSITPKEDSRINRGDAYEAEKLKIRAAVYRRVAEENPLAMADLLEGAALLDTTIPAWDGHGVPKQSELDKYVDKMTEGKSEAERSVFRDKLLARRAALLNQGFQGLHLSAETSWLRPENSREHGPVGLREKLLVANEIRLRKIQDVYEAETGRKADVLSLNQILGINSTTGEMDINNAMVKLTPDELNLLQKIRKNGRIISRDLGTIRMPNIPFLNDVILERANFLTAGSAVFSDTITGDITKMYETAQAMVGAIANPAALKVEEGMFPIFKKMVDALGDPLGKPDAQDKIYPLIESYLRFIQLGSADMLKNPRAPSRLKRAKNFLLPWTRGKRRDPKEPTLLSQWDINVSLKKKAQIASSMAQVFGGGAAPGSNYFEIEHHVKILRQEDILRVKQYGEDADNYINLRTWTKDNIYNSSIVSKLRGPLAKIGITIPKAHHAESELAVTDQIKKLKGRMGVLTYKKKLKVSLLNLLAPLFSVFSIDIFKEGGKDAL